MVLKFYNAGKLATCVRMQSVRVNAACFPSFACIKVSKQKSIVGGISYGEFPAMSLAFLWQVQMFKVRIAWNMSAFARV